MNIQQMSIKQVQEWLDLASEEDYQAILPLLQQDSRLGIKRLVTQRVQATERANKLIAHWKMMNEEEDELRKQGITYIAGLDEVGRGPLAGPVVAACVVLPTTFYLPGINDSKKISAASRASFAQKIKEEALAYSISFISAEEIDQINIYQATIKAMLLAIQNLEVHPEYLLIDAMKLPLDIPQRSIIQGDAKSVSIAAASILAKEARDEWMTQMSKKYPSYGFERNMGYGTAEHLSALHVYGPTGIHRQTFITKQLSALDSVY